MLVENVDDQTAADPSLLRIIARAHHIQARLIQNPKLTVHDIAREERVSGACSCVFLVAGARHHHGHHQWPKTAVTHRQGIDVSDAAAAGRLSWTAKGPRLFAENKSSILRVPASNHFGFAWRQLLRPGKVKNCNFHPWRPRISQKSIA
jgi:hypothetical protein